MSLNSLNKTKNVHIQTNSPFNNINISLSLAQLV